MNMQASLVVIEECARHNGVIDMVLDRVGLVKHRANATLGVLRAALVGIVLGDDGHVAVLSRLEGVSQAGDAAADYQEVKLPDRRRGDKST